MAKKLTKRFRTMYEKFDVARLYDIQEAILLLKDMATAKFIESSDVSVNLGIDPRKSEQNVRGSVVLPNGTGRSSRVAVFAQGISAKAAKAAGAEAVGMEELAQEIKKNEINFDVIISSPEAMRVVSQLGQILGPRGLMPNLKTGTITSEISAAVKNAKAGQINYRNDKNGIVHATFGKVNFEANKLKENLETFLEALKKMKPTQVKGTYIKKIVISSTMGIGITVDRNSLIFLSN